MMIKRREALEHIAEYWNRNRDDGAMHDALWHIIETAEQVLEGWDDENDKDD